MPIIKIFNMSKFRTQYEGHVPTMEPGGGKSLTLPDQAMSIQEIMRRFAAGMPLEGQRVPLYEGEDAVPIELAHMDLIDRELALKAAKEELEATKKRVSDSMRKAQADRVQKIVDKRVADQLAAKERFDKGGSQQGGSGQSPVNK